MAAAAIIGFSQVKHVLGVKTERTESFAETVREVWRHVGETSGTTLTIGLVSIVAMLVLKRAMKQVPGAALVVVIGSILAVNLFDLNLSMSLSPSAQYPTRFPRLACPR
ncbi:MAG: SulP family inorganic anion transporter [Acidimicrobiales bacterium]